MACPIVVYRQFTHQPDQFKLDFLFCYEQSQFQEKHRLSQSRARNQIRLQLKLLSFLRFFQGYFSVTFFLFFIKMTYDNVLFTPKFELPFLYDTVVVIKVIGHLIFYVCLVCCTLNIFISFYEVMLACQFLSTRLDIAERILNLLSGTRKRGNLKRLLNNEITALSKNYNEILRLQNRMSRHFDQALNFPAIILIFGLVYPALLIFEPTPEQKKLILTFYSVNYVSTNLFVFAIVFYNTKFLNSNRSFLGSLLFISKYTNLKSSIKLLNIHLLNPEPALYSFGYKGIYSYSFNFFIHVSGLDHLDGNLLL